MSTRPSDETAEELHERSRFLRALRVAMIRSNVPPLSWVWDTTYRLATVTAVGRLRRDFDDALAAIYLRGSAAMDFRIPGLSDIDLTLVLHDEIDTPRQERLAAAWSALARRLPVLDDRPWTLRIDDFRRLGRRSPAVRYRLMECRGAWLLLHGADVLADLDDFPPAQRLHALVDDLETRLTHLNGLLFVQRRRDGLELRRLEYLLYKLALDLARLPGHARTDPLPGRGEVREAFLRGDLSVGPESDAGADEELRSFVAFTARHRLRRTWLGDRGRAIEMAGVLLDRALEVLQRCYRDFDLIALPGLRDQVEHFYDGGRFLPTDSPTRTVRELPGDFPSFCRDVARRRQRGLHTILESHGLRVNLANVDPALGNCTVVPLAQ